MTIERLGKYEIRGTLGKGAMGTVYAAWDPIISRQVAIKTVRLPDASDIDAQEELARFKREAQAAGRLTHPNIVGIFDYGESDEVAYIVMEFVDGRTLKSVLDAEERMPVATVGRIMADLLAGLRYSHDRGVVHRDIKPANVMIVGGDGHGSGQAKIADFGIARIESSNLTQAGTIMGTPAYMSPEQFMGQTVDARTDIYSSGVLLFQLLTGERPFEGSMATIMHKALNTVPPKPSELSVTAPRELDSVVARAMARRPEDRFADAAAFAAAIVDGIEGRAPAPAESLGLGLGEDFDTEATVVRSAARPVAPAAASRPVPATIPPVEKPKQRSKAPLLGGVAVLALAAIGAGGAWWSGLIGAPEPPNAQINGDTRTVSPSGTGQDTVVAVAPPSAPDVSPRAEPPTTQVATAETTPTIPPQPRADVTQVVPPSTSRVTGSSDPPPQPAHIIPPAPPTATTSNPPVTPRNNLAGAPPLEPARVTPPVTAIVPTPDPRTAETRPPEQPTRPNPSHVETAPGTRLEPALVTPPPEPNAITPSVPLAQAQRVDPAPNTATPAIATVPVVPAAPSRVRAAEPQVATGPVPTEAVVPTETNQTAPPTPTPTPTPAAPIVTAAIVSPEALRRAIGSAVSSTDCAAVRGDLVHGGTISVQGVIGSGAPTQDLLRHLREAAPDAPLDWGINEVSGPYCGVLNLIRPYTRPFGSTTGGIEVNLKDGRTDLRDEDQIDILTQVAGYSGYLQVDYFSSDGSVLHVQTAAQGSPALAANSSHEYKPGTVGSPFGTDLIISLASSVPLFPKGQALSGDAEPYLRQLRTALDGAIKRRAELAAGALVVHTSPKS